MFIYQCNVHFHAFNNSNNNTNNSSLELFAAILLYNRYHQESFLSEKHKIEGGFV